MLTDHYFFGGPQGVSWCQLRTVKSCQQPPNISKHCQYKTNTKRVKSAVNTPTLTWVTCCCWCCRLMKEQGQSHAKAFQDFEDAFKSKLDAVMSEARPMGNRWGIDGNRWDSWLLKSAWCLMDFYDRRWWERCVWKVCGWCSANV